MSDDNKKNKITNEKLRTIRHTTADDEAHKKMLMK